MRTVPELTSSILLIVAVLAAPPAATALEPADAPVADPAHYRVVLENDRVRVVRIRYEPAAEPSGDPGVGRGRVPRGGDRRLVPWPTAPHPSGGGSMARYDYECRDCGQTFEVRERITEHEGQTPHECPECGSRETRQLFRSFYPDTASKT